MTLKSTKARTQTKTNILDNHLALLDPSEELDIGTPETNAK